LVEREFKRKRPGKSRDRGLIGKDRPAAHQPIAGQSGLGLAERELVEERLKQPNVEHGEGDQQCHSKQTKQKPVERQRVPHETIDDSGGFCHRMFLHAIPTSV
jgi:hypothetical protein